MTPKIDKIFRKVLSGELCANFGGPAGGSRTLADEFHDAVRALDSQARHVREQGSASVLLVLWVIHSSVGLPACAGKSDELLLLLAHQLTPHDVEQTPERVQGQVLQVADRYGSRLVERGAVVEEFPLVCPGRASGAWQTLQSSSWLDR